MPSIYQNAKIKKLSDGTQIYGLPRFVRKNVDFSDIPGKEMVIQQGDRLDIIAEQVYGDPTHQKAILIYNNIGWFFDVKPGMIIRLPFDINRVWERI